MVTAARIREKYDLDNRILFHGSDGSKVDIAIVAIFKGEDEYLREWLEFHRIVGIQHFFLYDNSDSEVSRNILQQYVEEGMVTYIPFADFPEKSMRNRYGKDQFRKLSMQNLAYGDCTRLYARYCNWLIKIDLDEFIYPLSPFNSLQEAFTGIGNSRIKGFSVRAWRFGPSGIVYRSGLPVIETYTRRNPDPDFNWKVVGRGSVVSTRARYHGCHTWFYKPSLFSMHLRDSETKNLLCINHYYIKSREEYLDKIQRHSVGHKAGKETIDKWPRADEAAKHEDEGDILRFLPELKKRLYSGREDSGNS